jgi:hypothetical protein
MTPISKREQIRELVREFDEWFHKGVEACHNLLKAAPEGTQ